MADWSPETIAEMRRLVELGLTALEIGVRLCLTRNAVIGKLRRLGIPLGNAKTPPLTPVEPKRIATPRPKAAKAIPARIATYAPIILNLPSAPPAGPCEPITIMDLTERRCSWPLGNPGDEAFRYCGAARAPEVSPPYCAEHAAAARGRGAYNERRALDFRHRRRLSRSYA